VGKDGPGGLKIPGGHVPAPYFPRTMFDLFDSVDAFDLFDSVDLVEHD